MLNVKNTIVERLLSLVAPHLCCNCGDIGGTFCNNCKNNIINASTDWCVLCGKSTKTGVCAEHKADFNQAYAVGIREGGLQRLIGNLKFRNVKEASWDIADLIHKRLPRLPSTSVFVPIPTTSAHIRERGYDHMLLIALHLSKMRRVPVEKLLVRRNTLTQHHANRKDRLQQAKTAFSIKGNIDSKVMYIILDDVITTGATISEAASLLRSAGAVKIWVVVTSRQPLD